MRVRQITLRGIPGIHDTEIKFPDEQVIALAGPNGTGKTRLLAALGTPWELGNALVSEPHRASAISVEFEGMTATCVEFRTTPDTVLRWEVTSDRQERVLTFKNGDIESSAPTSPVEPLLVLPAGRFFSVTRVPLNLHQAASFPDPNSIPRHNLTGHRMEDSDLEQTAVDAYVRSKLPTTTGEPDPILAARWDSLRTALDMILAPKYIEPPTGDSFTLKVCSPNGSRHQLEALSMGEQQALGIIGFIARHGWRNGMLLVDEPDAFLHPRLAERLVGALREVIGQEGQLIMATHSPSILDSLPTSAIVRLSLDRPATLVGDDPTRIEMYREAGFRVSALSQAETLVITEGDLDLTYLPLLSPAVARSTAEQAGGRTGVLRRVKALARYDLPVIGVIDGDALARQVPPEISDRCLEWAQADLEAVMLADRQFLEAAIEGHFFSSEWTSVDQVADHIAALANAQEDGVVAELAIRKLEERTSVRWPSTTGDGPVDRLRAVAGQPDSLTAIEIQDAIDEAQQIWATTQDKLTLVRGKRLAEGLGRMIRGTKPRVFYEQVAAKGPVLAEVSRLGILIEQHRLT